MDTINSIKDLYSLVVMLKKIKRQGWKGRSLEADSIADHTYAAMMLGFVLAKQENVDINKVIKMLLVHDLVMANLEDLSPTIGKYANSKKYKQKAILEKPLTKSVAKVLPTSLKHEYLTLFDEFQEQKTPESIVAREADKFETLLQGSKYEEEKGRNDILDEFIITYKEIFKTKTGKSLFNEIKKEHEVRKVEKKISRV